MLTFIKHRELEQSYQQFNFEDFMQLNGQIFRALENRKTQCIASSANTYFIKQHLGIGWKEIFKNLFSLRLPVVSAENEYRAIGLLAQLNIPTLKVVAYGKKGLNPASLKSFIMTEALQDIVSLEDLCRTWPVQAPTFTFKQALIKELARIASLIHQHGLNHRDFYLCHFLLRLDNLPKVKLHVIDLHRAQIRKKIPRRWIIKDLAGLYFSSLAIGLTQRDLLRFIQCYTQCSFRTIQSSGMSFWLKVKERGDKLYKTHLSKGC